MSQVIRISESIYERLEFLAKGFDTPGSVIERLLKFYEKHYTPVSSPTISTPMNVGLQGPVRTLNPDNPGNLSHTRILEGRFGNERVKNWMQIVYVAHKYASGYYGDFEALRKATQSNIVKGPLSESGYHEYPDIGISIQGADSNNSWRNVLHLAKEMNSHIEVSLQWRNNDKAAYPGQKGKLKWEPRKKIGKTHVKVVKIPENIFTIKATRGAAGKGKPSRKGFVVFKNSKVADPITNSYPNSMKILRNKLLDKKRIVKRNDELVLTEDYVFSSSSTAAMILMGRSANGLTEWKTTNGMTLQDYENQDITLSKDSSRRP